MKTIRRLNTALLKYIFVDSYSTDLRLEFVNDLLSVSKDFQPIKGLNVASCHSLSPLKTICNGINLFTTFTFDDSGELDLVFHGNYMDKTETFALESIDTNYYVSMVMRAVNHKMYALRIVDFNLSEPREKYYRISKCLMDDEKMENFISVTYEIPQFERFKENNKKISELTKIERWLCYFSSKTSEDEIFELGKIDNRIRQAITLENKFFENEDNLREYEKIEKENFEAIAETERVLKKMDNQ